MTTAEDIFNYIRFSKEPVDGYSSVKIKGEKSICSTCKNYDGGVCKKGYSFAGFVLWDDGTKTVVKCQDGDTFNG